MRTQLRAQPQLRSEVLNRKERQEACLQVWASTAGKEKAEAGDSMPPRHPASPPRYLQSYTCSCYKGRDNCPS